MFIGELYRNIYDGETIIAQKLSFLSEISFDTIYNLTHYDYKC